MSRKSYEEGVVLVRCPGCQNLHLIADRFGWFGEPGSIEQYLAERGEGERAARWRHSHTLPLNSLRGALQRNNRLLFQGCGVTCPIGLGLCPSATS